MTAIYKLLWVLILARFRAWVALPIPPSCRFVASATRYRVLASYSTLWPARAIPTEGRLISLELEETHARVARANLARAGVSDRTEVRVGPALETLPRLQKELDQPFCFSFIDADKANIPHYFDWAVKLAARLADPGR